MLVWFSEVAVQAGSALQVLAQILFYSVLFGALVWMVKRVRRELAIVDLLDASSVMLASGLLLHYFVLDAAGSKGVVGAKDLVALLHPTSDLGFSFLTLRILLAMARPPLMFVLAGGVLLLLISDGLRTTLSVGDPHLLLDGGSIPYWIFSTTLLGYEVLRGEDDAPHFSQGAWRPGGASTWLFWLGPQTPSLQYAVLLVWGALRPPLPGYVLLCGVVLLVVFAVRTYVATRARDALAVRQEVLTKRAEQRRILGELHDTVKQNIRGTSMMIEACVRAEEKGDADSARRFLNKALGMSYEASYQLSKPLDELRFSCEEEGASPTAFFTERLEKFGKDFGLEAHEDLQAPLEMLDESETVVAHRVCVEAFWNAVKHSDAQNLRLESRLVGSDFVVRLRDDGRGFCPGAVDQGLGLRFMRSRAEEVGAHLDLISSPGRGTTVQLRFSGR